MGWLPQKSEKQMIELLEKQTKHKSGSTRKITPEIEKQMIELLEANRRMSLLKSLRLFKFFTLGLTVVLHQSEGFLF